MVEEFASQTGLTYEVGSDSSALLQEDGPFLLEGEYLLQGEYRNHPVEIWVGEQVDPQCPIPCMYCLVRFRNPQGILVHLYDESLRRKIGKPIGWDGQDIHVNDAEFDKKFRIMGNKENDIRAILGEPSIRNRIMEMRDFHISIDKEDPNEALYWTLEEVSDPKRLRSILDTLIDIAERIGEGRAGDARTYESEDWDV